MGIFFRSDRGFLNTVGDEFWLLIVCLTVVITGTIWGFVDWMRTRTHKRKSQTDPAYADQTEPPPARGIIAFWVGFIFFAGCAIAVVIMLLLGAMFYEGTHGVTKLDLRTNPELTKAQIDQLQKALPKCKTSHGAK